MESIVSSSEAGLRLDLFLSTKDPDHSRSFFKKLIEEGNVLVNGFQKKVNYSVREGEEISCTIPPSKKGMIEPEEMPLTILYEDEDLIVLDKPAGLVVHPAAGHQSGTLVNALLHHCRGLSVIGGVERPGIVHRLDKETSGVLVVAKNDFSHHSLSQQFKEHQVQKVYLALVQGEVKKEEGVLASSLGRHPVHRKKISSRGRHGKEAVSHYKVSKRFKGYTLVEVKPQTGRTHQIRVHLSEAGYPIAGDSLYGGKKSPFLNRFFLHATSLSFDHPREGKRMQFKSPLPPELDQFINSLQVK
ncbi:MAG: RluA family pseudouridine synthase [Deltaproteobacteria bacterium]|nr:RluA family pseudouridine synthase [Deltaproteobacteria bacterium]